jgi:hypothetical protein
VGGFDMHYRTEADFPVLIRLRTVSFVRVADHPLRIGHIHE